MWIVIFPQEFEILYTIPKEHGIYAQNFLIVMYCHNIKNEHVILVPSFRTASVLLNVFFYYYD